MLGLPLGLGKANHIANALYARAAADRSIRLTIFTALTLEKPHAKSELERRFIDPVIERLFGGYPELAYAKALRHGTVPDNIEINEFFFLAGRWLSVDRAQQSYISANYTHASRYLVERGVNVVAQLVAKKGDRYSFSCNPDTILDVLQAQKEGRAKFLIAAQVNSELPFMPGDAEQPAETFAHVLDGPSTDFPLFAPPREPHRIPANTPSAFTPRGWSPTAARCRSASARKAMPRCSALILRHRENDAFRDAVARLTNGAAAARHRARRTIRARPLRRQRDVRRWLPGADGRRHPEARSRWRAAACRVLSGPESVLQAPARDAARHSRETADDGGLVHQRALWRSGRARRGRA